VPKSPEWIALRANIVSYHSSLASESRPRTLIYTPDCSWSFANLMRLRAAAITDIGRVRRRNEDRFVCRQPQGLFAVAEGIGGLPSGARAAPATINAICARFDARAEFSSDFVSDPKQHANETVADLGRTLSPATGIGSTLTLGYERQNHIILGHVGDSHCLRFGGGESKPLTLDQHVGNALVTVIENGEPTSRPPVDPSLLNALTQCIGQPKPVAVDISIHALRADDCLRSATDGVTNLLDATEISEYETSHAPLPERLSALIAEVLRRGARENATALLLEFA
jgi:serine/threonine protein phosphatase PrpC